MGELPKELIPARRVCGGREWHCSGENKRVRSGGVAPIGAAQVRTE